MGNRQEQIRQALDKVFRSTTDLQEAWEVENFLKKTYTMASAFRAEQADEHRKATAELRNLLNDVEEGGIEG